MAVFYAFLRLVSAALVGYTTADLIDHFSKGREARTGQPEPEPTIQNWKWDKRMLKSIRFYLVVLIIAILGTLSIVKKLKK